MGTGIRVWTNRVAVAHEGKYWIETRVWHRGLPVNKGISVCTLSSLLVVSDAKIKDMNSDIVG